MKKLFAMIAISLSLVSCAPSKDNVPNENYLRAAYYRGVWNQCFADVAIYADREFVETEIITFCTARLQQSMNEDWFSKTGTLFLSMPPITPVPTPGPQG